MNAAGTIRPAGGGYVGGVDQCAAISPIASSRDSAATACLSVRVPPVYCALMDPDEIREPPAPAPAPSERADEETLFCSTAAEARRVALLLDVLAAARLGDRSDAWR